MNKVLVVSQIVYAKKVGGGGAIANATEIDKLDAGAIAVLLPSGGLVPKAGIATAGSEPLIQFLLGTSQDMLRSGLINCSTISYEQIDKVTGVNKTMTIDFASLDTTDAGVVGLDFINLVVTVPIDAMRRKNFEVGFAKGATKATVVADLAKRLKDDEDELNITVSATGTVITIVGTDLNDFTVTGTLAAAENYVTIVTVPFIQPVNDGKSIAAQELEGSAHDGNPRYMTWGKEAYKQNMQADLSKTYTTFILRFKGNYDSIDNKNWIFDNGLTIAVETGSAVIADIKAILDSL